LTVCRSSINAFFYNNSKVLYTWFNRSLHIFNTYKKVRGKCQADIVGRIVFRINLALTHNPHFVIFKSPKNKILSLAGNIHYRSLLACHKTEADIKKWQAAFDDVVQKGEKLFHSALGSNTVSCDMCHPNASNTHPETYPKFQKQLGKVTTLRDMINWCLENPLEGKPLALDDPKMIALEAYITWERRGVSLNPGKH
jgi:thiosulfate dehydrogenase